MCDILERSLECVVGVGVGVGLLYMYAVCAACSILSDSSTYCGAHDRPAHGKRREARRERVKGGREEGAAS